MQRAAVAHNKKHAQERRAGMRATEKEKRREQRAQAEEWFAQFDLNSDGVLQRTELAALLKHISGNSYVLVILASCCLDSLLRVRRTATG